MDVDLVLNLVADAVALLDALELESLQSKDSVTRRAVHQLARVQGRDSVSVCVCD